MQPEDTLQLLRHHEYTNIQLKKFGHDLRKLLVEASKVGLTYTGSRSFVLGVSGFNYRDRLFVYPEAGMMNTILPQRLRQIANEIIEEAFISIKSESVFEEVKNEPGLCIQSDYLDDLDACAWATINFTYQSK